MKTKTEKLSQEKLLEILVREIEDLKKATTNIDKAAPAIEKQLAKLEKTSIGVDTTNFNNQLERWTTNIDQKLNQALVLPKWILYVLAAFFLWNCYVTYQLKGAYEQVATQQSRASELSTQVDQLETELKEEKTQRQALERLSSKRK